MSGVITKVSGPLIIASGLANANVADMVLVGNERLIGEILNMQDDVASIQVYEETGGIAPGAPVECMGYPMSVELGPGLLEGIYDGIQRPLDAVMRQCGHTIGRGVQVPALSRRRRWAFVASVNVGDEVAEGDVIGTVEETSAIVHKIMVPPGVKGRIQSIRSDSYIVTDAVATIICEDSKTVDVTLMQRWPVRVARPYAKKMIPTRPLCSGQRIIDTFFPIAKGGTGAVPGPFGSGKTIVQHQLAKWSDVDVVIYIGCGERGNEMTDVLREFPELVDPHTGQSLMKRTVLIANTSDMPVAAREISVYTGITIAEYYRDMGYHVAVIADSTSRWAEALREMSARLEEMPGEEGYPAYLASRLSQFYERAGIVRCLGWDKREGSVTAIGAVSPPGGDLSEPVTQATMRIVKVFWALDATLAYARHFPAIHWLKSHSLYVDTLKPWFDQNLGAAFEVNRSKAMQILQQEEALQEVVRLVGLDSLSAQDRLTLETARILREDFLQQNAFVDVDCFSVYKRQVALLALILFFDKTVRASITPEVDMNKLLHLPIRERLGRAKTIAEAEYETAYEEIEQEIVEEVNRVCRQGSAL